MQPEIELNSESAREIVKDALTRWGTPSRVGQAYLRFLDGVRPQQESTEIPLSHRWGKHYRDLLVEVRDSVGHPINRDALFSDHVSKEMALVGVLDSLYGPANNAFLKEDHRYSLEWTSQDSTEIAVTDSASKATGHLQVVNVVSPMPPVFHPNGSFSGGTAHAGVGFLIQPRFALTKLTMTPELAYRYNHLIFHDSPDTLSIATTRGFVRLLAFKVNLFNRTSELVAEWDKKLWDAQNQPIVSRNEDQQSGTFNGSPVELEFRASRDFAYAVCCVASVYVNRGYYGGTVGHPPEPTLCTGNLECDVPAMWLEQERIA